MRWLLWGVHPGFVFRFSRWSYLALIVEKTKKNLLAPSGPDGPLKTRPKLEDTFVVFLLPSIFSLGLFEILSNNLGGFRTANMEVNKSFWGYDFGWS